MSSSDEEDIVFYIYLRSRRRRKRFWMHPYIEKNINCRLFVAAQELTLDDGKFQSMYRMTKRTFQELSELVSPAISRQNTNMRECVNSGERILITLRYLATGCTFTSLALYFARGNSTISDIIKETTVVIWDTLHDSHMAIPTTEKWKDIANRFNELWNIPNCLGAIDGKHVRIQKLPNSGASNYNYKQYHSFVLLAVCNADGLFTMIETGYAGRNNDGGIFRASTISHWLERNGFNLPTAACLSHDESRQKLPYFFVGDNAFPLKRYLMRPYPVRTLDNKKRIFNYRLSRGRKTIECTFGMMTQKFQVLLTPIRCLNYTTIINIIKSVCVLHNFVRVKDGIHYSVPEYECQQENGLQNLNLQEENILLNAQSNAHTIRDYLANYFINPRSSLPWQYNYCV